MSSTQDYGILYSSINLDVASKEMKNIPLPTAFFSSKTPRDEDVSLDSYVDADFVILYLDMHSYWLEVRLAGSRGLSPL